MFFSCHRYPKGHHHCHHHHHHSQATDGKQVLRGNDFPRSRQGIQGIGSKAGRRDSWLLPVWACSYWAQAMGFVLSPASCCVAVRSSLSLPVFEREMRELESGQHWKALQRLIHCPQVVTSCVPLLPSWRPPQYFSQDSLWLTLLADQDIVLRSCPVPSLFKFKTVGLCLDWRPH